MPDFRIALAQLNPVMGDITGNLARARAAVAQAGACDVILFSELFITGYPPEDLVLKPALQAQARAAVVALAGDTRSGPAILMGAPWVEGGLLYNAMLLLDQGRVMDARFKHDLPNYGVFDEKRVFAAGPLPAPMDVRGVRVGVPVCEDIWQGAVCGHLAKAGAEILCVPNGSPFEAGKEDVRVALAATRAREAGLPLVYLNQVGGQDELVFDGASFVLNADGAPALHMPGWREDVRVTDWSKAGGKWVCAPGSVAERGDRSAQVYQAMMLGLYEHLEGQLDEAGFFHPPEKRPSMVRNLRAMISRARYTEQEARTFRGVITALSRGRGRVLEKLAKQKAARDPE